MSSLCGVGFRFRNSVCSFVCPLVLCVSSILLDWREAGCQLPHPRDILVRTAAATVRSPSRVFHLQLESTCGDWRFADRSWYRFSGENNSRKFKKITHFALFSRGKAALGRGHSRLAVRPRAPPTAPTHPRDTLDVTPGLVSSPLASLARYTPTPTALDFACGRQDAALCAGVGREISTQPKEPPAAAVLQL